MAAGKSFHEMMADRMSGSGEPDSSDDGGDPDYDAGLKDAVSSFIDAVSSKDVDAATDALKSAVSLCAKAGDGDDSGDASAAGGGGHAALLLIPHGGKGH